MPIVHISSGKSFAVSEGDNILGGALIAGVTLPYSCRTGRCGTCKARVVSGATVASLDETGLSETEARTGWVLTCARSAVTDVMLDIEDLADAHLFPPKTVPCRVQRLTKVAEDVLQVELRLPPRCNFGYRSGQYIDVIGHGGLRRSYSIANAPLVDKPIELHIRRVHEGVMSRYWFETAKVNDLLRLHGPLGTFFLREATAVDLVFLATGTGIAPIKAILQDLSVRGNPGMEATVFWGGRRPSDFYWDPAEDGLSIRVTPVLSRASADWVGHRGYVQQALLESKRDWTRAAVYACGSEAMIRDARHVLLAAGLGERCFFSDAFVCSDALGGESGPSTLREKNDK